MGQRRHAGYGKISRLPSEFDITSYIKERENDITVRVYRWSDGTYLEDQDMWWMSGIYRDVELINEPKQAVLDCQVGASLDDDMETGLFSVDLTFKQSEARGSWMLSYEGEEVKTGTFETKEGTVHVTGKASERPQMDGGDTASLRSSCDAWGRYDTGTAWISPD